MRVGGGLLLVVLIFPFSVTLGQWSTFTEPGGFFSERPERTELHEFESIPPRMVADAVWAYGDERSVQRTMKKELVRTEGIGGPERAVAFIRLALIDTNLDGVRALLAQACAADPTICDGMASAARREIAKRFVSPGRTLPPSLITGHP